jgi:hypothetical protein
MQDGQGQNAMSDLPRNKYFIRKFLKTDFQPKKETSMFKPAMAIAALMACSAPAVAATDYPSAKMHTALPGEALTVTDWYKQNV